MAMQGCQMVTRTRTALGPAFADLADDTEESVLGSSFHQDAIVDTYVSLKLHRRKHNLPWFIGNQTKLVIPRVVGPPYQPSPDLLIHPTLGSFGRSSLPIASFGPPALVIEVMSPATALSNDLSEIGKLGAYAASGVTEYLAFDIFGDYIPEMVRAWRLGPTGAYVPWEPDTSRRWVSSLGISFAPEDGKLRVYDETGELIPSYEDLEEIAEEREREIAALREELRRLRGEA
jgi:Uma2 family endonuclease